MTFIFTDNEYKQEIELVSISDALQLNFGIVKAHGIIDQQKQRLGLSLNNNKNGN